MRERFSHAVHLHQAGDVEATRDECREILRLDPQHLEALSLLGVVEHQSGNHQIAVELLGRLVELSPENMRYRKNHAAALFAVGEIQPSIHAYQTILQKQPQDEGALERLAEIFAKSERWDEAIECYQLLVEKRPIASFDALYRLGCACMACGRIADALNWFHKAKETNPAHVHVQLLLATCCTKMGRSDEGVDIYRNLEGSKHISEQYRNLLLGNCLTFQGLKREARQAYKKALNADGDSYESFRMLMSLDQQKRETELTERMQLLFESDEISAGARIDMGFGLGKLFRDLQDYQLSFKYFSQSNELLRATHKGDIEQDVANIERELDEYLDVYSDSGEPVAMPELKELIPIFIVGLPRSGSTLVEQVLSSHSAVDAGGETKYLPDSLVQLIRRKPEGKQVLAARIYSASKRELTMLRSRYLRELAHHRLAGEFVTDKNLYNFRKIGMLLQLFPNARIIECRRDRLDNCLSVFMTKFSEGHLYSTSMPHISRVHQAYSRGMRRWHELFPQRVHVVNYEAFVDNPEVEVRSLLNYCNLDYQRACIDFHLSGNTVRTASAAQVRRPFNKTSIGMWKNYASLLHDLKPDIK